MNKTKYDLSALQRYQHRKDAIRNAQNKWLNKGIDNMITYTNCSFTNTTSTASTYPIAWGNGTVSSTTGTTTDTAYVYGVVARNDVGRVREIEVPVKHLVNGRNYDLPDGGKLCVDFNGNYEVVDRNSKVTYKANTHREFNQYVSTSDLLEDFIKDLGDLGVKQSEVLNIPIELFINWLIMKAAEADGEPEPDIPKLAPPPKHHRCRLCGRFLSSKFKQLKLDFCNADHYAGYLGAH